MLMGPPRLMERGDVAAALLNAPHRLSGELETGAQEHWYLETQVCPLRPRRRTWMTVYSAPRRTDRKRRRWWPKCWGSHAMTSTWRSGVSGVGSAGRRPRPTIRRLLGGAPRRGDGPSGENPAVPRRRHDHDRQTPPVPLALRGRVRCAGSAAGGDGSS